VYLGMVGMTSEKARNPMKKLALAALLGASFLTATATISPQAFAQTPAPAPQQQTDQRPVRLMSDRIDARLAYIKTALKITPAQEGQWNVLADAMRKQAKQFDDERQARRAAGDQPASAIERLQQRQRSMALASASLNELLEAARPLYATFSDAQKNTADEMLNRRGGFHRHGRWH
jgi:hypothetical protein